MAEAKEPAVRVFERELNGETVTRKVTSESGAVQALFDGYLEVDKPSTAKKASATGGGTPANNAG